jgi:probable F420-dependent oxidoreductase
MKIGLVIMLADSEELKRAPRYAEIRDKARAAEEAGFDSIWLYDHLLYRNPEQPTIGIWECWTMLAALAEATTRVELGTLVACNSFRNPALLAKMAVTLDEVSNGRFILGLGAGWNKPEYDAFGLPFDHRVARLEEAVQIIKPLLRGEHVDFSGTYYQARDCELAPRGPRPSGPPLMLAGDMPKILRVIARYADLWNMAYMGGPETAVEPRAKLHAACAEVGRDPAAIGITALVALAFSDIFRPTGFEHLLEGSNEEIATALKEYERMGMEHVMFHAIPYYHPSIMPRLAEILRLYHAM